MADSRGQEKEWVPRSHIAGPAYGTLSRAAANKAKLFAQFIDEEAEENAAQKGRPDVGGAYTEVALIRCKDERDGEKYVRIMKSLIGKRAPGEAFHGLWCIDKGSGVHFSEFMLVSIGSPSSYVQSFNDRTEDDTADLVKIVKRYDSTIYITKATDAMKDIVKGLNAREQVDKSIVSLDTGTTFTGKPISIDIAESSNYRFETGQKLVADFLAHAGDDLNLRVERIETNDAAGMAKVEAGLANLYSSEYRNSASHEWRPTARKSIGFSALLNTPLAFILKMDDTHIEVVILDLHSNFTQDAAFGAANAAVKDAVKEVKEITVYTDCTKDKRLVFTAGNSGPKGHPENTYTQTNHVFGGAATFNVMPGTQLL